MLDSMIAMAQADKNIVALWLYGSHAKGNAGENSDYDLAVLFRHYEENPLLRRTRPENLALDWSQALKLPEGKLSVVDLEIAPIPLAMAVLTTGKQIMTKHDSKELFVTQKIMSKWEIDYQYHYKYYG